MTLRRSHSTMRSVPRTIGLIGARTTILSSPTEYLSSILSLISSAQHEITLSALYCGTGENEHKILAEIEKALSDERRPHLKCTFILDYSRTQRLPGKGEQKCSLQFLSPLLTKYGKRMKVLLYRMPQHFGLLNRFIPGQLSEILGVYHCKFCLFDQNVILTGANLSAEYLTNRQDRYMLVEQSDRQTQSDITLSQHALTTDNLESQPDLALFLQSFSRMIERHCYHVEYEYECGCGCQTASGSSREQCSNVNNTDNILRNSSGSSNSSSNSSGNSGGKSSGTSSSSSCNNSSSSTSGSSSSSSSSINSNDSSSGSSSSSGDGNRSNISSVNGHGSRTKNKHRSGLIIFEPQITDKSVLAAEILSLTENIVSDSQIHSNSNSNSNSQTHSDSNSQSQIHSNSHSTTPWMKPDITSNSGCKDLISDIASDSVSVRVDKSGSVNDSVVTTLRPLIQHYSCGIISESKYLLDLLFSSVLKNTEYPSPSSLASSPTSSSLSSTSSFSSSTATSSSSSVVSSSSFTSSSPSSSSSSSPSILETSLSPSSSPSSPSSFSPSSSFSCTSSSTSTFSTFTPDHWSKVVIASPYPSFLPSFTSFLLSISTQHRSKIKEIDDSKMHQIDVHNKLNQTDDHNKLHQNNEFAGSIRTQNSTKNITKNVTQNISDNIIEVEEENPVEMKFIISESRSHGFNNGGGLKKLIPKMHDYALQNILFESLNNIHVRELCTKSDRNNGSNKNSNSSNDNDSGSGSDKKNGFDKENGSDNERNLYDKRIRGTVGVDSNTLPIHLHSPMHSPMHSHTHPHAHDISYNNVSVCPYYRDDWTFHCKGIWLFKSKFTPMKNILQRNVPQNIPKNVPLAATYIGSSNFGERSCFRDFELGFVLHTNCPKLSTQLSEECSRLEEYSSGMSLDAKEYSLQMNGAEWYLPLLTRMLRTFL